MINKMVNDLLKSLGPTKLQDLAERLNKRETPVSPEETQWREGDYVVFKAQRKWRVARVVGFNRMCSEMFEVLVEESDGTKGGVRYGGHDMFLLERCPPDQQAACDSYFHSHPLSLEVLTQEDTHFKCLDCQEQVEITEEIREENRAYHAKIKAKVRNR